MTTLANAVIATALIWIAVAAAPARADDKLPAKAAKRPVTDTYHGVKVVDDYRWLEDGANPEVQKWTAAQREHARAMLEALPGTEPVTQRLLALDEARPVEIRSEERRVGKEGGWRWAR